MIDQAGVTAALWKRACSHCGAVPGEGCRNLRGRPMKSVHLPRMVCPVCEKPYTERSGKRFRHWIDGEVSYCALRAAAPSEKVGKVV